MIYARKTIILILLSTITAVIVACSPATTGTAEATETVTEVVTTSVEQTVAPAGAIDEAIPGLGTGQRILVWIADASQPGDQNAGTPGELAYFNPDGSLETVLTLPNGTTRVTRCGADASSPDDSQVAILTTVTNGGNEVGTLYLVNHAETELITAATDLNPVTCSGSAPFQFSPDGSRFAYIDWSYTVYNAVSPYGVLHIHDSATGDEIASFENVTSFDMTSSGAVWVAFYANDDGEATEVAINTWDGSIDQEVSTLVSDEENDCYYVSAQMTETNAGLFAMMGYRCNRGDNTRTQWQLYTINLENRAAQLEQSGDSPGSYFVFSDTNAIFPATDGSTVVYSLPDGFSNQSVSLFTTAADDIAPQAILNRFGLMSSVSDLPYDANNATAQRSPDARFLAIVANNISDNNSASLYVFDLNSPNVPPIEVDAGDSGDVIVDMAFNQSSDTLYYVAGADEGENNALYALNLNTGTETRIRRGRYGQMVVSPDSTALAIMNWVEFDPEEPRYLTLEVIEIETTAPTPIYIGGEVDAEGKLINPSFAYPLAWRSNNVEE